MNSYFIIAGPHGGLRVAENPPPELHYVVKADTESEAIKLTLSYRIGHHWACEMALAGDIRISGE